MCAALCRRCVASRELLKHHQRCVSSVCPVCMPVKQYVQRQRAQQVTSAARHHQVTLTHPSIVLATHASLWLKIFLRLASVEARFGGGGEAV